MEFRYTIEPVEQILSLRCWGAVTPTRLIDAMKRIGADAGYHPQLPVLADFREATGEWDYSEVQGFRDYLVRVGRRHRGVRWGALMSPGSLVATCHVVVVITEAMECGIQLRWFEDPAVANEWVRAGKGRISPRRAASHSAS